MIAYLEKSDIGATLATWLYCCIWQHYSVEKEGYQGYIHWPNRPNRSLQPHQDHVAFSRCPNMYEWWFEQPTVKQPYPPACDAVFEWENMALTGKHVLMGLPLPELKAYFQKHLIFNAEVERRTAELVAKYGIDFNNTMAVTWRGCDSTDDGRPRLDIGLYFPFIDEILEKDPNTRIFATAEETTVVDKVKARYPNVFTIDEFFSAPFGYRQHSEYVNPASGYERGMQTCMMMNVISKCKYLVKNRSSMSGVAGWLSRGHIVNIAHPENLGHGFDITKVEINGQLFPLYR